MATQCMYFPDVFKHICMFWALLVLYIYFLQLTTVTIFVFLQTAIYKICKEMYSEGMEDEQFEEENASAQEDDIFKNNHDLIGVEGIL